MKCVLLVNKSELVLSFRQCLIRHLQQQGYDAVIIAHDDDRKADILELGVSFYCVEQDNRGMNPFPILRYQNEIRKILVKEKPDIVFTFQVKANTFGILAAKMAGIKNIFSMVEGAGDVFIKQSLTWKIIRTIVCGLYKLAFSYSRKVFFLNREDHQEFLSRRLISPEKCVQIPGIGVDLEKYACKPMKTYRTFLMVARLHREKGVFEYCECARRVKEKYQEARFCFLGPEREIKVADIQSYIEDGSIEYLGVTHDVLPYLENCSVMILPSYREGMPMSIMEAEAVGRAIITTDNVGCRDTVVDGYNGFLIPGRDVDALVEKCIYMIEHPEEVARMGANSRKFAEERFDQNMINRKIMDELGVYA